MLCTLAVNDIAEAAGRDELTPKRAADIWLDVRTNFYTALGVVELGEEALMVVSETFVPAESFWLAPPIATTAWSSAWLSRKPEPSSPNNSTKKRTTNDRSPSHHIPHRHGRTGCDRSDPHHFIPLPRPMTPSHFDSWRGRREHATSLKSRHDRFSLMSAHHQQGSAQAGLRSFQSTLPKYV